MEACAPTATFSYMLCLRKQDDVRIDSATTTHSFRKVEDGVREMAVDASLVISLLPVRIAVATVPTL